MNAVKHGSLDDVLSHFDPDCEWTLVTSARTFRGTDLREFLRRGFDAAQSREDPDVRADFATGEWGVFEYVSRGTISKEALHFGSSLGISILDTRVGRALAGLLLSPLLVGRTFEVAVCFVYHVNSRGLIERVHEYAATRSALNPLRRAGPRRRKQKAHPLADDGR
jgi:hypothetical protein